MVPGSNPGGPTNKINTYLTLEKNTTELCYTLVHSKKVFYIIFMNLAQSVKTCFKKFAEFNGRASRSEFWWFTLFLVCVGTVTGTIDALLFGWEFSDPTPLTNIATIVTLIPSFSVSWRRLHDVGKSGWWNLITLTIIRLIPLIIWCTRASDNPNQYGEIPTNYLN